MEFLIIIVLILINGIFSMSEIALVSSRKFKLEKAAKNGSSNAQKALDLSNNPNTFLSTVQIGITLIGILTGIFSGDRLTGGVKNLIGKVEALRPYSQSISVLIILILITYLSIVFGELIPKRIGLMFPERIASAVARPMTFISIITKPFIWLLTKTNDLFLRLFGLIGVRDNSVSEEEIKAIVQESADSGEIREIEQSIVNRVFALGDRKVTELMTHRRDLVCFNLADDFATIKQRAKIESHSVYPVFKKSMEHLIGIVSVKDIFPRDFRSTEFNLSSFVKQPLMIPESMPAYKVLERFRLKRIHYAFVVDEYGAVQGMVSMDDIIDALIGDVSEYNQQDYQIIKREENNWLADGQYPYFEFLNYFQLSDTESAAADYNTLAGFVIHLLQHIPVTGEKVTWEKLEFEIVDMDGQRIDKVMIRNLAGEQ